MCTLPSGFCPSRSEQETGAGGDGGEEARSDRKTPTLPNPSNIFAACFVMEYATACCCCWSRSGFW
ncbi:hypothetical protein KFK09_028733 [Dendrobium nobile]|uniref:Uncharacterized protein n=1 Tax=Dendrobium nobile TaxID=94219 RepID=A0A8T3A2R1_DENNO|nr:hypothetical protein KFK09_028733 [Dendrobium nobile]